MRSSLPKVLHPLCGRPLILWPVSAAREAGAGKIVVVDNPKRRLEDHLPDATDTAIQAAPNGAVGAVTAAAEQLEASTSVAVITGDVPLITPEPIAELVSAQEQAQAAGSMPTMALDAPGQYGRVIRDAQGVVEKVVEAKG